MSAQRAQIHAAKAITHYRIRACKGTRQQTISTGKTTQANIRAIMGTPNWNTGHQKQKPDKHQTATKPQTSDTFLGVNQPANQPANTHRHPTQLICKVALLGSLLGVGACYVMIVFCVVQTLKMHIYVFTWFVSVSCWNMITKIMS